MSLSQMEDRVRRSFERQAFMATIGAVLDEVSEGRVVLRLPFAVALTQQNGFLHGGVIATVADVAGGYASWHAAAFQFINPKAWMMTVTAVSLYVAAAPGYWVTLAVVSATFLVVSVPSITIWAAFGAAMKSALREPSRVKLFNRAMAVLTILSAGLVFLWS